LQGITNTKETSYQVPSSLGTGTFYWTIAVIRNDGGRVTELARAGEIKQFTIAGGGGGGGGTGGGGSNGGGVTPPGH
jgi:hypothetical protein